MFSYLILASPDLLLEQLSLPLDLSMCDGKRNTGKKGLCGMMDYGHVDFTSSLFTESHRQTHR